MFVHYVKVAFRNLWKYKGQSLIGIIGLAIGFTCFALCTYLMQLYYTSDTEYQGANRMYCLTNQYDSGYEGNIYAAIKSFSEVEKVAILLDEVDGTLLFDEEKLPESTKISLLEVDTCFLDFFSLKILEGNPYSISHSANSIVLFENKAKELTDNYKELVGKTVSFKGDETEYQIAGIVKKPENSVFMSIHDGGFILNKSGSYLAHEVYERWDPKKIEYTFLCLAPNTSLDDFRKKLETTDYGVKINPKMKSFRINEDGTTTPETLEDKDEHFSISPIQKIHKSEKKNYINLGIFVVGLLIFLMTLFNYLSFQAAQFYNRLKECAVRKTNGSGRAQIFLLFFSETLLAFVFAFLITPFLLRALIFFEYGIVFQEQMSRLLSVYLFQYFLFTLLLIAIFCLIPSYTIDKLSVRTVFLGLSAKGRKGVGRDILLFIQLIILFVFLSASTVVSVQTYRLRSGILDNISREEQKNIFSVTCSASLLNENIHYVMQQLSSSTLFENVLSCSRYITDPPSFQHFDNLVLNGEDKGPQYIDSYPVSPDFFEFFRCRLIKGQFFDENSAPNDIVIDKAFADLYGVSDDPIGQMFEQYRIIGIIEPLKTSKTESNEFYYTKAKRHALFYNETRLMSSRYVIYAKAVKGKNKEARAFLKNTLDNILPERVSDTEPLGLKEEIGRRLGTENYLMQSLALLFVISLIIGLLNVYSAISMSAEKRRREVAIRKINGALLLDIILLFFRKYVILWTIVCILGFPFVYYYANNWLDDYINRIPVNIFFFIGIYSIILFLIILTIFSHILKVARINPAETLKTE